MSEKHDINSNVFAQICANARKSKIWLLEELKIFLRENFLVEEKIASFYKK